MSAQRSEASLPPRDSLEGQSPPIRRPGRIDPTLENPSGYPPYRTGEILKYTNRQIQYYIQQDAIPVSQIATFAKLCEQRQRVNQSIGLSGDSEDELPESTPVAPRLRSHATPQGRPRVARIPLPRPDQSQLSYEDDGESDSDSPSPIPGWKGIKFDNKIAQLKQGGGLSNFNLWLNDLRLAFEGDPNRFPTGATRILLAAANLDDSIRQLYAASATQYPAIRHHWRKFLRWVRENTLHGTADRAKVLTRYSKAQQGPTEEPAHFYSRLLILANELGQAIDTDNLFPRFQTKLQRAMIRGGRLGDTPSEMIRHAQDLWGTFDSPETPEGAGQRRGRPRQDQRPPSGQKGADQPQRGKLSPEELKRRQDKGACFNCGETGHSKWSCKKDFNPNPPAPLSEHRSKEERRIKAQSLKRGRSPTTDSDHDMKRSVSPDTDADDPPAAKRPKND